MRNNITIKSTIYIHTLLFTAVFALFSVSSSSSYSAVLLNSLVVLSSYVVVLFLSSSTFRPLLTAMLTLFFLLLYLFNFISLKFWNEQVTLDFLYRNIEVFITQAISFPWPVLSLCIITPIALYLLYRRYLPRNINRSTDFGALALVPIVLLLFYSFTKTITSNLDQIWQGEPVYELFKYDLDVLNTPEIFMPPSTSLHHRERQLPNIILVHADALRADRLSAYNNPRDITPFIDTLIENGATYYPYSFSNCSESICGFSSVLNSSFKLHGVNNGLIENLSSIGYFTNFIGTGDLNHANLSTFFSNKIDNFLRADHSENFYKHDDRFILQTLKSFPNYQNISSFFYLRLMSSHPLGSHREKFKKYVPLPGSLFSMFFGNNTYEQLVNAHDNMAHQFDAYLADIFSILEEKGFLDNVIVVIYGDHGDAMGEHGQIGHYQTLFNEEIHVPIIFWTSPNIQLNLKPQQFSTLMDIAPTLLHSLGSNVPSNYLGHPLQVFKERKQALLDNKRGDKGFIFQEEGSLYKVIKKKNGDRLVFDLINDFDEKNDLSHSRPDLNNLLKH